MISELKETHLAFRGLSDEEDDSDPIEPSDGDRTEESEGHENEEEFE